MYKIKRFSLISESDFNNLINSAASLIDYRARVNSQVISKLAKDGLFGSSSRSSKDLGLYHSTVRSGYRLRSYLRSFDESKMINAINSTELTLNNGVTIQAKNYVEMRPYDTKEYPNFSAVNSDYNPILLGSFHESWDQILDVALSYIDYTCDFYTYKKKLDSGEVMTRILLTIDDYNMIVSFLAMFGYLRKVYGGVAGKIGVLIYNEEE